MMSYLLTEVAGPRPIRWEVGVMPTEAGFIPVSWPERVTATYSDTKPWTVPLVVDEAAFHPYAAANFKAYRPVTIAGRGQLLIMSTAPWSVRACQPR